MVSNPILIVWDHSEEVPTEDISAAAQRGFVHMHTVDDTHGDFYAIVASKTLLDGSEIQSIYEGMGRDWIEDVVPTRPVEYRTVSLEVEVYDGPDVARVGDRLRDLMGVLEDGHDVLDWKIVESPAYGKVEE